MARFSIPKRITGFHQDEAGDWVAELECGHTQHMRHEPPWLLREWVLDPKERAARIGLPVACRDCVREAGDAG